jgi:hypothetical protein
MLYPPRFPGDDEKKGDVVLPKVITIPDIQPLVFRKMLQCICMNPLSSLSLFLSLTLCGSLSHLLV